MNTTVMERPSAAEFQPPEKAKTIGDALKSKDTIQRFQQAVPKHLSAERMLRVCALAVYRTPDLAKCEVMSLLGAMLTLASLGLEPNTPLGHAYLIPFQARRKTAAGWEDYHQVQVVIGYKGLIDLARRSGMVVSIRGDVVYGPVNSPGGDRFEFEYGSNQRLTHKPGEERTTPIFAYAYAKLQDGEAFEVLPYKLVMKIRDKSQGYVSAMNLKASGYPKAWETNPWVAYEHEMAAKTMIRRLAKFLPMSVEFARAVELDEIGDTQTIDFAQIAGSNELIEHVPTVPFEPPADRQEQPQQETVAQKPPPRTRKPPADPQTVDQPRKPNPPEPARVEPERAPERVPEPVAEQQRPEPQPEPPTQADKSSPAFELADSEGQVFEWDDWSDFPGAYKEELKRAFEEHGIAGGDGFYETNRNTFLTWAKENTAQGAELEELYHTLRRSSPAKVTGGGNGLF